KVTWILNVARDDDERLARKQTVAVNWRPLGDRDDVARRSNRADRSHHRRRHRDDVGSATLRLFDERADFCTAQPFGGHREMADRRACRQRFLDQMRAVQQYAGFVAASDRAKAGDQRILTAGNFFHGRVRRGGADGREGYTLWYHGDGLMAETVKER